MKADRAFPRLRSWRSTTEHARTPDEPAPTSASRTGGRSRPTWTPPAWSLPTIGGPRHSLHITVDDHRRAHRLARFDLRHCQPWHCGECSSSTRTRALCLDRHPRQGAPFDPRAVVDAHARVAEQIPEDEPRLAGTSADRTVGDDLRVG